jgi:hypothetical protein
MMGRGFAGDLLCRAARQWGLPLASRHFVHLIRQSLLRGHVGFCISLLAWTGPAGACGDGLGDRARRIENAHYTVVFRTVPDPIEVGTHFSLDVAVCPRGDAEEPRAVRVDAQMPEHRHGMNYRPVVVARGPGVYRADGFMFHMPGRWDLLFDVVTGAGSERLIDTLRLE